MREQVQERRVLPLLPIGRKRILYKGNYSRQKKNLDLRLALQAGIIELKHFHANATDLKQCEH